MKYRILGATLDKSGIADIPDDVRIIGALYHPMTGELTVVVLKEVQESETVNAGEKPVSDTPEEKKPADKPGDIIELSNKPDEALTLADEPIKAEKKGSTDGK